VSPDEFAFAGAFEEGIRQVGNSVPPLFIRPLRRDSALTKLGENMRKPDMSII
jgi:hypothetical protein